MTKAKAEQEAQRHCARCGLPIIKSPYGRWKHVGNRYSGKGCGAEPTLRGRRKK
jgi:hypothetical protein